MRFAERMSRIAASPTMAVAQRAAALIRQGVDVVDFSVGEPDFPTPDHVKAAAIEAIHGNFTRYTASAGIVDLKAAIAARYATDYGVRHTPDEVIVTAGGKQALFNVAMALFEPGDEVITHAPYWPTLGEQVKLAEATIGRAHV